MFNGFFSREFYDVRIYVGSFNKQRRARLYFIHFEFYHNFLIISLWAKKYPLLNLEKATMFNMNSVLLHFNIASKLERNVSEIVSHTFNQRQILSNSSLRPRARS